MLAPSDAPLHPPHKTAIRALFRRLGRLYLPGPRHVQEAVTLCQTLASHNIPATIGAFSAPTSDPRSIIQEYCFASDQLRHTSSFYLSVRLPALHFDPGRLSQIATTAFRNGHGIHIDSFGPETADRTLHLLEAAQDTHCTTHYPTRNWYFSLSLPSRWKRSFEDADRVARRGIRVRLIKGEFSSGRASQAINPNAGFVALAAQLAGSVPELALATHDSTLARETVDRCLHARSSLRLELLYGLPMRGMLELARELRLPVTIYVPYGELLLLYATKMVLTSPRKFLWAIRDLPERSNLTKRIIQEVTVSSE